MRHTYNRAIMVREELKEDFNAEVAEERREGAGAAEADRKIDLLARFAR